MGSDSPGKLIEKLLIGFLVVDPIISILLEVVIGAIWKLVAGTPYEFMAARLLGILMLVYIAHGAIEYRDYFRGN